MDYRYVKFLDREISLLGMGNMRLPTLDGKIDYEKACEIIDYAMANGVNYYDTAWFYHNFESETFLGHALKKYNREDFVLVDKLPLWECNEAEDLEKIFSKQLEKCQTDYFDIYLIHNFDKANYERAIKYNAYDFLLQKKKEGKIKHIGVSFHDDAQHLNRILDEFDFEVVQLQLNYFDWDMSDAKLLHEICVEKGLPIVVMEPVRGGMLANISSEIFKEANNDVSVASWAIRYVASLENVVNVLSGMSTLEQVADNLKTLSDFQPITEQEHKVIQKALENHIKKNTIPCTKCNYCEGCPEKIDIPEIFEMYNNFKVYKNEWEFKKSYWLKTENKADKCIECRKCMEHCPQGLDIILLLKNIKEQTEQMFKND